MKIAVLLNGIEHEGHRWLLKGIEQYAREKDISISVFACKNVNIGSEDRAGEARIFDLPDYTQYDGLIFVGNPIRCGGSDDEIMGQIRQARIPVISIEHRVDGMPVFYSDNRGAMCELVSHLIEVHGVKNICYLSGPEDSGESAERLSGARQAAVAHGITLDDAHVFYGDYGVDSGTRFVKQLMETPECLPEAIVCANDFMALGVYIELCRHGIQIGKDVLLTGFDNMSDTIDLTPAITTLEKPQVRLGYEACRNLVENRSVKSRKFKVKCCFRGSCGCPEERNYSLPEVQLRNVQVKMETFGMVETNKYMVSDLNTCDSVEEFYTCIKNYIRQFDFHFVYLCFCEGRLSPEHTGCEEENLEKYTQRAYIPVAYEMGEFVDYPYFPCKNLLPEECKKKIGNELCLVEPIHFRKKCLGYLVMCGGQLSFNAALFQNWMRAISSTLETILKQEELKRLLEKLNSVWMLDSLTQTYNRAGFFQYAEGILEDCRRKHVEIGVLFVDLNKLKRVNDTYGHKEGDFYIRTVADCMGRLKGDEQLLMRYGGDEFVVLGSFEAGTEFDRLLEELNPGLEKCRKQNQKAYEMSVSIGFHSVPVTEDFKLDHLMEQADREMYEMKKKRER